MEGESLSALLVSTALVVGLTFAGLALVQVLAGRAVRVVQAMKHLREARRQQIATFVRILQWGANVLIVGSALLCC